MVLRRSDQIWVSAAESTQAAIARTAAAAHLGVAPRQDTSQTAPCSADLWRPSTSNQSFTTVLAPSCGSRASGLTARACVARWAAYDERMFVSERPGDGCVRRAGHKLRRHAGDRGRLQERSVERPNFAVPGCAVEVAARRGGRHSIGARRAQASATVTRMGRDRCGLGSAERRVGRGQNGTPRQWLPMMEVPFTET